MSAVASTTEHSVTLPDGRRLVVREAGDPAGVPLVVHHGTPSAGTVLGAWADDATTRGLRLLSYDRAGYAGSDRCAGRDVAAVVADLDSALDQLGVGDFVTWGVSGGGPHALACAALLPSRVRAVACLSGVAPFDAEGLDPLEGMGQDNVEEFGLSLEGEDALRPWLESFRVQMLASMPADLSVQMQTVLSDVDVATLGGDAGGHLHASMVEALTPGVDGWVDDDLAFVRPWGFQLDAVRCPALVVQGGQDLMVPAPHGAWLAERVPGATAWSDADAGHLFVWQDVGRVHAWLLERWRA